MIYDKIGTYIQSVINNDSKQMGTTVYTAQYIPSINVSDYIKRFISSYRNIPTM